VILNQLNERVFWSSPDQRTDRPVIGAVVGDFLTLIVDAGNSVAHAGAFLHALSRRGVPPPRLLFFTHSHWDHVFGASAFEGVAFIAHASCASKIRDMSRLRWDDKALDERVRDGTEVAFCRDMIRAELPDRSELSIIPPHVFFEGRVELDLGGARCLLEHVGGDHAEDSCAAYLPGEGVVFAGDCLYGSLDSRGPRYSFEQTARVLDCLLGFEAESYVFGHASTVTRRSEVEAWRELLRKLAAEQGACPDELQRRLNELVRKVAANTGFC
jgi:glyoxylase-like metal-dependent hydrolase (beta-lactamase superfamily II)